MPAHNCCRAVNFGALFGMRLYILLNLLTRNPLGIEASGPRYRRGSNKGLFAVEQIKARTVNPEITPRFHILGIAASFELLIKPKALGIHFPPITATWLALRTSTLRDHLCSP